MRRPGRALILGASLVGGLSLGTLAHERLRVGGDGPALFWPDPSNVAVVIQSDGSDDLPDGSHETALRLAIGDWNGLSGTEVFLNEDTDPDQQARTDWKADNLHLIWFDEDNSSGYFGAGSGVVALTPVWYGTGGKILDADVLFNGGEYRFTTSGQSGFFDVGDVGAHELGHLLGLDHSGWAGSTMYPYVDPDAILHRSPSRDEAAALREIAPSGAWGRIAGSVRRPGGEPLAGAHLVAVDAAGRTSASTLSAADGTYVLHGLEAGAYTVYADPLDEPVSGAELSPGHLIETDFGTTVLPEPVEVPAGATLALGPLTVEPDSDLNLGERFDALPLRAVEGHTVGHLLRGRELDPGCTLWASDPTVVVEDVAWHGSSVTFQVHVPPGSPAGHVDLLVERGNEVNILPAALEITPPDPVPSAVSPGLGPAAGGTPLTIHGERFRPGARVVIGDRIYRDGQPGGCTVVDEATITLTTQATAAGTHDVVVLDPSGVEGRLVAAFQAALLPVVETVFPPSGDRFGGTEVVLTGAEFSPGLTVRIDGLPQADVVVEDSTQVRVVTGGGLPGVYLLEVENPDGALAQAAFVYVDQPDPLAWSATPEQGLGGTSVTLYGSNFPADARVRFGADPNTGLGGAEAEDVTVLDAHTLLVTAPGFASSGKTSILVEDGSSGQATVLEDGFAFTGGGSDVGGGCFTRPHLPRVPTAGSVLAGAWWILLLWVALSLPRRRGAVARAEARA